MLKAIVVLARSSTRRCGRSSSAWCSIWPPTAGSTLTNRSPCHLESTKVSSQSRHKTAKIDVKRLRIALKASNFGRNIHMIEASTAKLTSMHFHAWELGLKTGMRLGDPLWRPRLSIFHPFFMVFPLIFIDVH